MLRRCSTPWAPWYVVPADDKAVRNYLIARMLVETLESTTSVFPPMDPDVRAAAAGFT
jgi:polyphosphate kinase 2 (PPK2 family)